MYRVKENKDLKELENFGFEYNSLYECYERTIDFGINRVTTRVFPNNVNYRKNQLVCESSVWMDILFPDERIARLNDDLIQADLVEKVEEGE